MRNFRTGDGKLFVGMQDSALIREWVRRYQPTVTTINERPYSGEPPQEFDEYMDYLAGRGDIGHELVWKRVEYWTLPQTASNYQQAYDEAWNIVCFEGYRPDQAQEKDYQRRVTSLRNAGYSLV